MCSRCTWSAVIAVPALLGLALTERDPLRSSDGPGLLIAPLDQGAPLAYSTVDTSTPLTGTTAETTMMTWTAPPWFLNPGVMWRLNCTWDVTNYVPGTTIRWRGKLNGADMADIFYDSGPVDPGAAVKGRLDTQMSMETPMLFDYGYSGTTVLTYGGQNAPALIRHNLAYQSLGIQPGPTVTLEITAQLG